MRIEDIYAFYKQPPAIFLNQELAVCYILSVLLEKESYGTELIQQLEQKTWRYRLSDPVLCAALKFLEDEGCVRSYFKRREGRGRPRRMYQLTDEFREQAYELAHLWKTYVKEFTIDNRVETVV